MKKNTSANKEVNANKETNKDTNKVEKTIKKNINKGADKDTSKDANKDTKQTLTEKEKEYIIKTALLTDKELKALPDTKKKTIEKTLLALQPKLKGMAESKPVEKLISKLEVLLDKEEADTKKAEKAIQYIEAGKIPQSPEAIFRVVIDDDKQTEWDVVYINEKTDTVCLVSADYEQNLITSYKTFVKKNEVRTNKQTFDILHIIKK